MNERFLIPLLLAVLPACGEKKQRTRERLEREREQQAETSKAQLLGHYSTATQFDARDPLSLTRKLTIDVQDTLVAAPHQLYWTEEMHFDLHRSRTGIQLTFRGGSDHWVSLDCSDGLASRIRRAHAPNNFLPRYLFVFRLASATPLQIELRAEREGSGEDMSLSVAADNIDGRLYTGTLIDFSLIDPGISLRRQ
ncbi:MAG: hypothetical protein ABMA13_12650 [Chthoniobacteraceae bacterium]